MGEPVIEQGLNPGNNSYVGSQSGVARRGMIEMFCWLPMMTLSSKCDCHLDRASHKCACLKDPEQPGRVCSTHRNRPECKTKGFKAVRFVVAEEDTEVGKSVKVDVESEEVGKGKGDNGRADEESHY